MVLWSSQLGARVETILGAAALCQLSRVRPRSAVKWVSCIVVRWRCHRTPHFGPAADILVRYHATWRAPKELGPLKSVSLGNRGKPRGVPHFTI